MSSQNSLNSFLVRLREIDRAVYFSLFWTVLAHALTRGSQVLRELAIASKFGISADADAIVLLLLIPTFIHQYLIANFPQAAIPIYLDEESKSGAGASRIFHGSVIKVFGLILLSISALLFTVAAIPHFIGWFPTQAAVFTRGGIGNREIFLLSGILMFRGIFTLLSLGLLAHRNFTLPALVSCITPLLVSVVLFLSRKPQNATSVLQLFLIGQGIELVLILVGLADEKIRPDLKGPIFSVPVKKALRQHYPLIIGSALMGMTTIIERWRVGSLPVGELSAFQYAALIVTLPTIILALPLSQICLTYFSRLQNEHLHARLAKAVGIFALLAIVGGASIALFFAQVAQYLTSHIYAFGVFKSSDHERISLMVTPFAIQIPFYLAGTVLTQALSAMRENLWIALGSGMNVVFHFILSGYMVRVAGAPGVALTTSLTYLFSSVILAIFLLFIVRRRLTY